MSAARSLGNLGNQNALTVDTTNLKVGIVSTSPVGELQVGSAITMGSASGIISATAYYGDGANLENVASAGLGTAISSTKTEANNLIYYTNAVLGIGSTTTVVTPASTNVAYTQYTDIDVNENCDLIVADGDDFVPDVLGLSTAGISNMSGAGGRIRAGQFVNNAGSGAPQLPYGAEIPVGYGLTGDGGINISGFATAGGFVGDVTGNVTGNVTGTATGLSGAPDVDLGNISAAGGDLTIRNITGVAATFTGTLTYEDVTNVDVLGIATYRSGVQFGLAGVGGTITGGGSAEFVGIVTVTQGTDLDGYKVEEGTQDGSTSLSGEFDFELENGHIQRYSAATGGNYFPDIRVSSTQSLASVMGTGDVISVTLIVASSSHYLRNAGSANDTVKIDNSSSNIDIDWVGGSAPSAANGSGFDVYAFTIMKTAATPAYYIIGNALGAA